MASEKSYVTEESFEIVNQFKNHKDNLVFWEATYSKSSIPSHCSTFANFVLSSNYYDSKKSLMDMACGNGRDTFAFAGASQAQIIGIDACATATRKNNEHAVSSNQANVKFETVFIESNESLRPYLHIDQIYARFFIHAIDLQTQTVVVDYFSALAPGSRIFLEYRTVKDPLFTKSAKIGGSEAVHTHYRRFINHDEFKGILEQKGFQINFSVESTDLSPYKDDNPCLGRVIATKLENNLEHCK